MAWSKVGVGFALAFGRALDLAQDVAAQLVAGPSPRRSASAMALNDAPVRIAALAASATRWPCASTVRGTSPHARAQPVGRGLGDCDQFG